MKLKSPTDKPVHVALTSGQAISIGPNGREVDPLFARDAFAAGCMPADSSVNEMTAAPPVPKDKSRAEVLQQVLAEMKAEGVDLTGAGLPNRNTVSARAGWNVSAVELTDAWNSLE